MRVSAGQIQKIGVVSDTHGHLSESVAMFLSSVDLIVHAGDIDTPEVIERLRGIGTTVAVRGNMDWGAWAAALPAAEHIEIGENGIYILHDIHRLDLDPPAAGIRVVISGHTHHPDLYRKNGVIYLNPGSCSFPRSGGQPSVGWIEPGASPLNAGILPV